MWLLKQIGQRIKSWTLAELLAHTRSATFKTNPIDKNVAAC